MNELVIVCIISVYPCHASCMFTHPCLFTLPVYRCHVAILPVYPCLFTLPVYSCLFTLPVYPCHVRCLFIHAMYVACLYPCHVHLSCLSIPSVMLFIHAYDGCFSMMSVYPYHMHLSCLAIWWLFIQAGSASDVNGALFHHTEATCTGMPCPPYDPQKELTCTICTK